MTLLYRKNKDKIYITCDPVFCSISNEREEYGCDKCFLLRNFQSEIAANREMVKNVLLLAGEKLI